MLDRSNTHGCLEPCPKCKQGCPICHPCDLAKHRREASQATGWLEDAKLTKLTSAHEHQFTVPVETIAIPEVMAMAYEGRTTREYQPATMRVTKLRCSGCTEEVERA